MSDNTFHHIAHEYVNEEVNVVTTQGNFEGRLLLVGNDVLVLESRMVPGARKIIIRIAEVVALFRAEIRPTGPFGFMGAAPDFEESHESRDRDHN